MSHYHRGVTLVEVVVVVVVVGLVFLVVAFALPRQRESARLNGCRRNLMQIGIALALYDKSESQTPSVPALDSPGSRSVDSPLQALLETLGVPDFRAVDEKSGVKRATLSPVPRAGRIPGFLCESDPYASDRSIVSPVSYRATTGDLPAGTNGAFAPGRKMGMADVEAGDGRSYTAAFSERLIGNQKLDDPSRVNYYLSGPITGSQCPALADRRWLGDAGAGWSESSWQSTLYNHALVPNGSPSCITGDRANALMGASSGHIPGVNVLLFDGSVRTVTPSIEPHLWKAMATTHGNGPAAPNSPAAVEPP